MRAHLAHFGAVPLFYALVSPGPAPEPQRVVCSGVRGSSGSAALGGGSADLTGSDTAARGAHLRPPPLRATGGFVHSAAGEGSHSLALAGGLPGGAFVAGAPGTQSGSAVTPKIISLF